jgi:hypothetical protein
MVIENVKKLIASGDTKAGLELIMSSLSFDSESANDFILLNSRYVGIESLYRFGLINLDDYRTEWNKIHSGILEKLDESSNKLDFIDKDKKIEETKLLFLASTPKSTTSLKLKEEYLEIRKSLRRKPVRFQIVEEFDVTLESFFSEIKMERPAIVQFSGHGGESHLILSKNNSDDYEMVPWRFMLPSFNLISDFIECIFINSVNSASFAREISKFIPYVIGIKGGVPDVDAIKFPSVFYSTISYKKDYKLGFEAARVELENRLIKYDLPMKMRDYLGQIIEIPELGTYCLYINGEEYNSNNNVQNDHTA